MYFGLSEDERLVQDSLRGTLERHATLDIVRNIVDGDAGAQAGLKTALDELAIEHMLIPEAHGGLGLGLLPAALVQEMLGRYVVPSRFMSTALATLTFSLLQDNEQAGALNGDILSGDMRVAVGLTEAIGSRDDDVRLNSDNSLSGLARFVLDAQFGSEQAATHYLVTVKQSESRVIALVEANNASIIHTPLTTIDKTRDFSNLSFDKTPAVILASGDAAAAIIEQIIGAGRVLLAADIFGASEMMLEKAIAYAKERRQFNRVIGSFQAVKHMCAESAAALEPCRSLIWYAAHAQSAVPEEFALMSRHAKAHLSDIGQTIARVSTEIHGGMGITDLLGLHYWFKRIGVARQFLGGPVAIRTEAASLQF